MAGWCLSVVFIHPLWIRHHNLLHIPLYFSLKGSSIYDVHKKIRFLTPSPSVHMGRTPLPPLWTSTRGRHEIHTALLKWLVQRPTGPKAEIQLYDSNLFKMYY